MFDLKEWRDKNGIQVGRDLGKRFEDMREEGRPSLPTMLDAFANDIKLDRNSPLRTAAAELGRAAEKSQDNPYHNPNHFADVTYGTAHLVLLNQELAAKHIPGAVELSKEQMMITVLAAAAHDLGHDGKTNSVPGADGKPTFVPFRLEQKAVDLATPILRKNGVSEDHIEDISILILGTEPIAGAQGVKAAYAHITGIDGKTKPPVVNPKLERLLESPELAASANLLGTADILPSIVTDLNQRVQSNLLSAEWGRPTGPKDTLFFVNNIVGELAGPVAGFFNPNVNMIRLDAERALALQNSQTPQAGNNAEIPAGVLQASQAASQTAPRVQSGR